MPTTCRSSLTPSSSVALPLPSASRRASASAWPLERTSWTKLYLDAAAGALDWKAPGKEGKASFEALGEILSVSIMEHLGSKA